MTTFLLIRHATNDTIGHRIAGRSAGISLNEAGRRQAEALAARLDGVRLAALYTSPLERTRETAAPLAARQGVEPVACEALLEIDYGAWTGLGLEELRQATGWREWNSFRSGNRVPGGETALEVQARMVRVLEMLARAHPGEAAVGLVSHGDPIRAALGYYAGIPIDLLGRLEISPASASVLQLETWGARILRVNDTGPLTLP
jgi:probable phosphoglycerate mutase